jgi:hypothetical protein
MGYQKKRNRTSVAQIQHTIQIQTIPSIEKTGKRPFYLLSTASSSHTALSQLNKSNNFININTFMQHPQRIFPQTCLHGPKPALATGQAG